MALWQFLRIGLPLGALALLSTVFLVSRSIDPERAVKLSDVDVETLAREPRIGTARIAGVTRDDTALIIEAAAIRAIDTPTQGEPVHLHLDAPDGTLDFTSNRIVSFSSQTGTIDQINDMIEMTGDVVLYSSDGYRAEMPRLTSALSETRVLGSGGIRAEGPPGEITADRLSITIAPEQMGGYLLAFTGNVRLIYLPDE